MAAEGTPVSRIAEVLTEDKVPTPAAHLEAVGGDRYRTYRYHDPCLWSTNTVIGIIGRQEYLGHTVLR